MDAVGVIRSRRGLAATFELHRAGVRRGAIAAAIGAGAVIRVRQGWYADARLDPVLIRTARVGGRATCLTALRLFGIWTPACDDLHVSVAPNAVRLRSPEHALRRLDGGAVVHWNNDNDGSRLVVQLARAVVDAADCIHPDQLTAVADSALRARPELRREWDDLIERVPRRARAALLRADGICESGIESLFWSRIGPLRARTSRQASIPTVGRVDFLVGSRLVIEVDGSAHHTGIDAFESDRRRDALLSALGFRVLRFSYWQVVERWPEVDAALNAALARLDHL